MARIECPDCGERVKYHEESEKLRCPKCGKKFRASAEDAEDKEREERPRRRKQAKKSSNNTKLIAIIGGVLLAVVVGVGVFFLVRGKGGGTTDVASDTPKDTPGPGPGDSAKVTAENFKNVGLSMSPAEFDQVLGAGREVSFDDVTAALPALKPGGHAGTVGGPPRPPNRPGLVWRRWVGKDCQAWVAFTDTKHGKLSVYGSMQDWSQNNSSSFTMGDNNVDKMLEDGYAAIRKNEGIRKDAKWVRGPQSQKLLLGEWRNQKGDGWLFKPSGGLSAFWDFARPTDTTQPPTYRFVDDRHLEIVHPPFQAAPTLERFEYYIVQDELVLIDVGHMPCHRTPDYFYRVPGQHVESKLIQPLVTDITGPDKLTWKFSTLKKFGKHALPALRNMERTAGVNEKMEIQNVIRDVEARIANEEKK